MVPRVVITCKTKGVGFLREYSPFITNQQKASGELGRVLVKSMGMV